MPHIHTEPGQHDQTVSAYIIRTDGAEPQIMLHHHKKLHKWMQFGGHIELDETPWQAISHELLEETGYKMSQLQIMQPKERIKSISFSKLHPTPLSYVTHPFGDLPHFHTDIGYFFTTNQAPKQQIGKNESAQIKLMTRQEVKDLSDTFPDIKQIAEFCFVTALPNWEAVPTSQFN